MDWVQCNNCGAKPNQVKMFLTRCAHVFCQSCTEKAKESQCYLCKKPLTVDEINKNLRPDLMELFKDPRQVSAELMTELQKVSTFQAKQREIFMKFKNAEMKKETDRFNDARTKQMKITQEIEKRKKAFGENNALLKAAKEEKKQLTARLHQLQSENSTKKSVSIPSRHLHTRTEPPTSKSKRIRPPPSVTRKASHDFPLNIMDQSTSKIVTSTPICNVDYSRRDYMNRMFGAGFEHPSPIPRQ
ncbi:hypothetical protein CRE_29686 [Caenorhabditis remanei]|uniref:Uncharacterized protein n=1 Tax=Caenorhabditis remanei TaxID=31234 RepID=E3LV71_CAERE|nr:hypothetical protein CRE_29686 [Caenorhabditis remanei]